MSKLAGAEDGGWWGAPPLRPPVRPRTAARRFARSKSGRKGWGFLNALSDSRQRSGSSPGVSLGSLGTKAPEFTSIKAALAFVPRQRRTRSGPFSRPDPPGVHCQGQPNVCPSGPFDCCPPPTPHCRRHLTCTVAEKKQKKR